MGRWDMCDREQEAGQTGHTGQADRSLGWAGIGERGGVGMGARRQEGGPSPGWWMAVVRLDVAKMVGNWRAGADVGTRSGECKSVGTI